MRSELAPATDTLAPVVVLARQTPLRHRDGSAAVLVPCPLPRFYSPPLLLPRHAYSVVAGSAQLAQAR